jgi:hypothetical protein
MSTMPLPKMKVLGGITDYAKIADALEGIHPIFDEVGRARSIVIIHPNVLKYVCDGLRRLSQIESK